MTAHLAQAQRELQALISDPDGADGDTIGGLVRGSPALPAGDRVALYRRAYHLRLLSCLRESYPALRHALTAELFDAFALEYLAAQPSRSYTLNALGARWPEHLEATRPDRDAPAGERERWPDFLVDLATLERTFCEVYDAPGAEGATQPTAADLPEQPAARSLTATVRPLLCLRLLRARFAVGAYMLAVRAGDDPPLPAARETWIAVSRRDYVVTLTELDGAGFALLGELTRGKSVGAAARAAAVDPAVAWSRTRGWADCGFFSEISAAPAPAPAPRSVVQSTRGVAR